MRSHHRTQRFAPSFLVACVALATGCSGDFQTPTNDFGSAQDVAHHTQALTANSLSFLTYMPSPTRLFQAVAGRTNDDYAALFTKFDKLAYVPVTLSGIPFPNGSTRFSAVFQRVPLLQASYERRGLTVAQITSELSARSSAGYQIHDLSERTLSDGTQRYDAIWLKFLTAQPSAVWADASAAVLTSKIIEYKNQGLRPLRIHGFQAGSDLRFSATFVKDAFGTSFRTTLDQSSTSFTSTQATNFADGYYPVDVSVHYSGTSRRYNAVWVKSSTLVDTQLKCDQSESSFESDRVSLTNKGYVLSDVEVYPESSASSARLVSSVWVRNLPSNSSVQSNLGSSFLPGSQSAGAINAIQTGIAGFDGRAGLFVEDLTNGNYVGFHHDDPQYLASTSKVFVAAAVMKQVDLGTLTLAQAVPVTAADIEETGDKPKTTGNQTVDQLMRWMLNDSSTNATDRLIRLIGIDKVNQLLIDAGLTNVGEITSICELEMRVHETWKSCVRNMTCSEFMQWERNSVMPTSTTGINCVTEAISGSSSRRIVKPSSSERKAAYTTYYASFANTATPLEYARFWRRLLSSALLSDTSRDYIADVMNATGDGNMDGYTAYYERQGIKGGDQYHADCKVGWGATATGADGAAGDIGQYTFGAFTEGWLGANDRTEAGETEDTKDDRDEAEALQTMLRDSALRLLAENRALIIGP